MHSLTAIVVFASLLTNLNSFKQNPVNYQENLLASANKQIVYFMQINHENETDELATLTQPIEQVLGESTKKENFDVKSTAVDALSDPDKIVPTQSPVPTSTPIPTNSPVPTPTIQFDNSDVVGAVERAANEFGVDMDLMKKIATCESGFNALAHNKTYDYAGLYQFHTQTWITTRSRMGLDSNPALRFSAQEAARTAAFKIKHDGTGAWNGCL